MQRRIFTTHRSVRWFVALGLLAWIIFAICSSPSDRNDALIQTVEDIENSDFFDLLTKSRVQNPGKDIETVQHLSILKLPSLHPEDRFLAETAHRLMFVRLSPERGPPLAI